MSILASIMLDEQMTGGLLRPKLCGITCTTSTVLVVLKGGQTVDPSVACMCAAMCMGLGAMLVCSVGSISTPTVAEPTDGGHWCTYAACAVVKLACLAQQHDLRLERC